MTGKTDYRRALAALVVVSSLGLSLLLVAAHPAAAQTATPGPEAGGNETALEQVDRNTFIVRSSYHSGNRTATVVLEQRGRVETVTVADAGAFVEGGEVATRTVVLEPGQRVAVTLPATKVDNRVGLAIRTESTLFAHIIEREFFLFSGDATWQTAQLAGASGFAGGLLVVGVVAWRRKTSGEGEVSREL